LVTATRSCDREPLGCARSRTDGAAPLIRSNLAIRMLRDRIERVAATDFTALIEGGFGPQPHPDFIEVSDEVAVSHCDGEVAGAGEDGAALNPVMPARVAPDAAAV
jgi:hypothetical protein